MEKSWQHISSGRKTSWLKVWTKFKNGDKSSFEKIYSEFVDILFAYGSKMTTNHELVRDAIHDLFIDIYDYNINLQNPENLEFYLIKSLKNLIIRKLKADNLFESITENGAYNFNLSFDLEQEYLENETQSAQAKSLTKILQELDPQKRELVFLRFKTGLSYEQIGQVLNIKKDTAKKQIYRLIEQIRKQHITEYLQLFSILLK